MNADETEALVAAWELHHKILLEIKKLANINPSLAYGVVRTAEIVIDIIFLRRSQEAEKQPKPEDSK